MVSISECQADAVGFKFFVILFKSLLQYLKRKWDLIRVMIVLYTGLLVGPFLPFIVLCTLISPLWPLIPLYCWWYIHDWNTPRTGGRKRARFRNIPIISMKNYFPSTIVKTADLPPTQNYLLCAFPHGVACFGILSNFMSEKEVHKVFPGIEPRGISMNALFNVPIGREFLLSTGFSSSNAENILTLLTHEDKNKAVILIVGGAAECMIQEPGTNKVIINERKGFVKLALKAGAPLVPVYTFGENDIIDQYRGKWIQKFQNFVRRWLGVPPILIKGRGIFQRSFGILPHRKPLFTVVGKPIALPKCENPSNEEIDKYHKIFISELKALFEAHKEKYDKKGSEAKLICL